jgi:hypothetical protein
MLGVADAPLDMVVSEECQEDSAKKSPSPSTIFEVQETPNRGPWVSIGHANVFSNMQTSCCVHIKSIYKHQLAMIVL